MTIETAVAAAKPRPARRRNRLPVGTTPRQDSLDREVWLDFLKKVMGESGGTAGDPTVFNGRRLQESHARSLHRWRAEGWAPNFFTADAWCIYFLGQPIDIFLHWCEEKGLNPWRRGIPPDWYEGDDWEADLESSDPAWRRECRQEHGRRRRSTSIAA